MRIARIVYAVSLAFILLPPAPASAATRTVEIRGNYYYAPITIAALPGDTVEWFNDTATNHTVTSNSDSDETFNATGSCGLLQGNDCLRPQRTYSHRFDQRGTFTYYCKFHGSDAPFPDCGMCGRVVVKTRSGSIAPTTPGSVSPTATASSPSASPSTTISGSPVTSPSASTLVAEAPVLRETSSTLIAVAALAVSLLGGTGIVIYRTMIRGRS